MKNITLKLVSIALLSTLFFACSPEEDDGIYFAETNEVVVATKVSYSTMETKIMDLINAHRKSINLSELSPMNIVSSVADGHTNYMIVNGEVSHDNFAQRAATLQQNANANKVGENVAYGFGTAEGAVNGWLNSPAHKAIIETEEYTHFGISTDKDSSGRNYFTHIFIQKNN
jgi:uncharacterized protein YkwD